jgi:exodeoxyribonuclease V alpha subunit
MYSENTQKDGRYDPKIRIQNMREYFSKLTPGKSIIFYYANYDNPFSGEDKKYVLVGLARLKNLGEELEYENQGEQSLKKYGSHVWARVIESYYPEQGMRIPYHRYMDNEEILSKLVFIPENQRNFKYGTRIFSDDEALGLVERFLEIAYTLKELGDTSEDWDQRINWLSDLIGELWESRGLYPGLSSVMSYLNFYKAIPYIKENIGIKDIQDIKSLLFDLMDNNANVPPEIKIESDELKKIQRQWKLLSDVERDLLRDILPRFDITREQIEHILSENRETHGIYSDLGDILKNPYILTEEYIGQDPDDRISFYKIDHGVFPSPDLGGKSLMDKDDPRRLRSLCVQVLKEYGQHSFLHAQQILSDINKRLSYMPDYKRQVFTLRHIEIDEVELSKALFIKINNDEVYLYRKEIYELEREIEQVVRSLVSRPQIRLKFPVTDHDWENFLYDSNSPLLQRNPEQYKAILAEQIEICKKIFNQPISIIHGAAGTGKTTILKTIIQAIEKGHGEGTSFQLLAPTGKAADRLRERTGKSASTIHSFLASRGWLNDNMSFKRDGGKVETSYSTYIIDESSMLDTQLLGTFFKSVNWNTVQRLIFVGDPNQLPPIGIGKPFSDLLQWLEKKFPQSVGKLTTNCRLLERGGISLKLASLFTKEHNEEIAVDTENILQRLLPGGEIDRDLKVVYWKNTEDLQNKIYDCILEDIQKIRGEEINHKKLWEEFALIFNEKDKKNPEAFQVISPYRGEAFGTEAINQFLQTKFNGIKETKGTLGGITYFDKVIQFINRPKSNPYWGYNTTTGKRQSIEIYNGELGFVKIHGYDKNRWKIPGFRIQKFQVSFNRKEHIWIDFTSKSDVEENLELAYAISVHKSQGSEFKRVYFILPKSRKRLLSQELFYTGLTRAQVHTTLFIEEDISPLMRLIRKESAEIPKINSSIFEFDPVPLEFFSMSEWYEEGKIHRTLSNHMVRSKSEALIANILFKENIPFQYEVPLYAPDGTFYIPDFTIQYNGETWYLEHLGMLENEEYKKHWGIKEAWYKKHGFSERLIVTDELNGADTKAWEEHIKNCLGINIH